MLKLIAAVALALPSAGSLAAQALDSAAVATLARTPGAPLPFDPGARMRQLPNGLRYYIRANAKPAHRAELRLVVNVGSVVEDDDQRGIAHVLEHMAFNGTKHFGKSEIVNFIEHAGMKVGADLNAGTGFDETIYQLQLPSDTGNYVARGLDWFADIAGGAVTLDSVEMNKERPVIIEEWRLGKGAEERIQEKQLPVIFRNTRYTSRLPIGTKESLDTFTRAQLARFYRDWYRPDLIAVVVVGDINPDSIEAMIAARFGSIAPAPATARSRDTGPVPGHAETLIATASDAEAASSNVGILWKQPVAPRATVGDYKRELTSALFLAMLNDRYQEIIRKPGSPFVDAGASQGRLVRPMESFSLSAIVSDDDIARGLGALLTEAERARRFGFTATELDRQKAYIIRSMDIQLAERDKTESAAFAARYSDHFLTGDQIMGIELRAPLVRALIPSVSLDDVNALSKQWLVEENRVILASGPVRPNRRLPSDSALRTVLVAVRTGTLTAYADATTSSALVPKPPAPGRVVAEQKIDAIGVTSWTLSNGVHVLIKPTDFQNDEILVAGVSLGGASGLSPERYYSARLAPLILERNGAGSIDATALQKLLAGKNVGVSADIGDRDQSVSGSTSPRDLDAFFEVMWAKLMTPRMDADAFRAFKQQYTGMVKDRSNNPMAAFVDTIGETMSQKHPLAKPVSDSIVQTLDQNIARDVFVDRFRDFSDFTFVIVGAVTPASVRPIVEKWIAALPSGGRVDVPKDAGMRPPGGHITKVVRKGADPKAQTSILITGEIPWTPDAALRASAVSGILSMRMRETLREDLGGTYGVGVAVTLDRWPVGRFTTSVAFGSDPQRVDSLGDIALAVLRKFAAEGPTNDELAKIREAMLRSRETDLKQNQFWIDLLESQPLWGDDPVNTVQTFDSRVRALDAATLQALARTVLNETNIARFTLVPERISRTQ